MISAFTILLGMHVDLDKIDLKILRIMQKNARCSAHDIGNEVCLSTSATQRRINAMRDCGVIQKEVAILSAKAVGRDVVLIVEVILENDTKDVVRHFVNSVEQYDAVTQFYYVTGASDYVLIFHATDMAEYDKFTQEVFFSNVHVKTFNTKVVIRPIKVTHELTF